MIAYARIVFYLKGIINKLSRESDLVDYVSRIRDFSKYGGVLLLVARDGDSHLSACQCGRYPSLVCLVYDNHLVVSAHLAAL